MQRATGRPKKVNRWLAWLAFAALSSAGVAPAQATTNNKPGAGRPAYASKASLRLVVGDTGIYRLSYTGTIDVDFGLIAGSIAKGMGGTDSSGSRREVTQHQRTASLHWRVVAEDAAGWLLAARLQDVDFRMGGSADLRRAQLEQPFSLRMDRNGRMHDFTFRKGYSKTLASAVRGMVEPLQVVVADDGRGLWMAQEETGEATFETRYQRDAVDTTSGVMKLSRSVKSAAPSAAYARTLAPLGRIDLTVAEAQTRIDLALSGKGVKRLETRQTVSARSPKGFLSSHVDHYVAERVTGTVATLPASRAATTVVLDEPVMDDAYAVDPDAAPAVTGRDVAGIMRDFAVSLGKNMAAGHRLLTNYVRQYPERAPEIARELNVYGGSDADKFVGFGFAAMAAAGHAEAQKVLVSVASESGWRRLSREKAVIAMMDLKHPQTETLAALWKVRSSPPGEGPDPAMMQSMATNAYGALGDIRKGNKAVTATVLRTLGEHLKGSGNLRQKAFALDALSNVGDPAGVLPLVEPYFTSPHEDLRGRAFSTFRLMTGEPAFQAFATRYAAERSAAVRREAVRTVEQMSYSAARNDWARKEVATTQDKESLQILVKVLGERIEAHPENATLLRSLLNRQTDRRVRRAIYAFVSPTREGGK